MERKEVKNGHQMSRLMNLVGSSDAKRDCETEKEKFKLEGMLEDHKKLLYPNCEDGSIKLGTTLELLRWKTECGLTDSSFEKMLKIMKPEFPKHNELLESITKQKRLS